MTDLLPPIAIDVRVDATTSDGAYALLEVHAAPGAGVPRHVGRREEVFVHVLAGRVAVRIDRAERELAAGDHAVLPRGVPRDLTVLEAAHLLLVVVPAGAERLAALVGDDDADADDVAALLAAAGFSRLPA